jgi:hypothetical protein
MATAMTMAMMRQVNIFVRISLNKTPTTITKG